MRDTGSARLIYAGSSENRLTPRMIGYKRFIRSGLIVSVIFHLGVLIVALLSVSPNAFHAPLPDAMVVELVTMDELPRFEGTLSNLHSSGSETPSPADGKGPVTQAPPPKPQPQTKQETQQRAIPPHEAQEATAPRPPAPEATQAELVRTEKTKLEKQNKSSDQQPAASPPTEPSPQQPNIAEEVGQYLALGGPLGGGFAAPPVDANVPGYDWTAPFRERVGMCSKLEGVDPGDKVNIKIRVSFNRDGTLMSVPHLLVPAPSAKQKALMESAVDALQRCQPFTMLPAEKYQQWKTMEVYVTPLLVYR
jgi:hypothetical protein